MNWRVLASFLVALFLTPVATLAATQSSNSSVATKTIDGKTVIEYSITQTTDGKTETKSQSFEVTGPFQLNEHLGGSSINVSTSSDSTQTVSASQQSQTSNTSTDTQTVRSKTAQASGQTPTNTHASTPAPTPAHSPTPEDTPTASPEPSPSKVSAPFTVLTPFASPSPAIEKPDNEVTMRNNQVKRLLATAIILLVLDIILIGAVILLWLLNPHKPRSSLNF